MGALSDVLADRATGASSQWCNTVVGGDKPNGSGSYLFWDILMGGFPGRPNKDGAEALCSVLNSRNIPVEVSEVDTPVRIERLEIVPDTCGPGRYRGACAVRKDVRFLGANNRATPITDRHIFPPHGIHGGREGACGLIAEDPEGDATPLHSKGVRMVDQNRVVRFQVSGAGGYGPPVERDPEAVLGDVLDGFVSAEAAEREYGVVVAADGTVDAGATEALRERMRADG